MGETKLVDIVGQFIHPLQKGDAILSKEWTKGRIIVSTENIWMVSNEDRQKIELDSLERFGGKFDFDKSILKTEDYLSLIYSINGNRAISLITSKDINEVKNTFYDKYLNNSVCFLKHPVKKGGVVKDSEWEKTMIKLQKEKIGLVTQDGKIIKIDLGEVQDLGKEKKGIKDNKRQILKINHVSGDNTTVESHVYVSQLKLSLIEKFINENTGRVESEIELSDEEEQILIALYSGVSPFEIPEFVGLDVDNVEEIYEKLIEKNILDEIRVRREVELTPRGRNLASKHVGE